MRQELNTQLVFKSDHIHWAGTWRAEYHAACGGTHHWSRPLQPGQQPALQLHRKRRARPFPEPNIRCFLKKPKCKILNEATTTVEIDPGSSQNFDTAYFAILKQRKGLFQSDAALLTNRTPNKIVGELLNSNVFFREFAQPMKRMGAIGVLPGTSGEIRKKCSVINSWKFLFFGLICLFHIT